MVALEGIMLSKTGQTERQILEITCRILKQKQKYELTDKTDGGWQKFGVGGGRNG